jgi:hypothetical protein
MINDGTHGPGGPADERAERALDRLLGDLQRSYNVPREPLPLDAMWKRIEAERRGGSRGATGRGAWGATGRARSAWWIGVAAALAVGIGIGRISRPGPELAAVVEPSPPTLARTAAAQPYDGTTARYLGQTAALLIALPAETRAGRPDQRFVARAIELLTTTRLLLDSPAAADPKVRALLEDVELVLAQIAHLEAERGRVEYDLIAQALEQRDLLPRLHSAVAAGDDADD